MNELNKGFVNAVIEEMRKIVGDNATVELQPIIKNNGVKLHGVIVRLPEESITPTMYIEDFAKSNANTRDVAKEIITKIAEVRQYTPKINPNDFTDFEKIKDKICLRLINKNLNKELFSTIPYRNFYDLAIILVIEFGNGMSAKINFTTLNAWNKSYDTLFPIAKENTRRILPVKLTDMYEIMSEISGLPIEILKMMSGKEDNMPSQYVLTNESQVNGATSLLYEDVLKEFADMIDGDFAILPSSIHEVILQPILPEITLNDLSKMVTEVNDAEVPEGEILSYHAYIYRKETGKLEY